MRAKEKNRHHISGNKWYRPLVNVKGKGGVDEENRKQKRGHGGEGEQRRVKVLYSQPKHTTLRNI